MCIAGRLGPRPGGPASGSVRPALALDRASELLSSKTAVSCWMTGGLIGNELVRVVAGTFVGMLAILLLPFLLIRVLFLDGSPWLWLMIAGLVLVAWSVLRNGVVRTVRRRIPARILAVPAAHGPKKDPQSPTVRYRQWMLLSPVEKLVVVLSMMNGAGRDEARQRIRTALDDEAGRLVFDDFRDSERRNKSRIAAAVLSFGFVAVYFVWRVSGSAIPGPILVTELFVPLFGGVLLSLLGFFGVQAYAQGLERARDALVALNLLDGALPSGSPPKPSSAGRAGAGS